MVELVAQDELSAHHGPCLVLALGGLELVAQDELVASVALVAAVGKVDMRPPVRGTPQPWMLDKSGKRRGVGKAWKVTLEDLHSSKCVSVFSVYLYTCPVPLRGEALSLVLGPLRRHLRVIAAAARGAFHAALVVKARSTRALRRAGESSLAGAAPVEGVPGGGKAWVIQVTPHRESSLAGAGPVEGVSGGGKAWVIQVAREVLDLRGCLEATGAAPVLVLELADELQTNDTVYLWCPERVSCETDGRIPPASGGVIAVGTILAPPAQKDLPPQ
ncbi:hypothetical protein T484DRAFT_1851785, partial [Baffinella frigidus]